MRCRHSAHPASATLPPAFLAAVQELRAAGREPYAYGFPRTHTAAELQQLYADLADGAVAEGACVAVAGRVMSRRFMGKLAFFKLVDASGSVQVGVRAESGEGWAVAHAIQRFQATRLTLPAAAATCQANRVVVGLANAGCTPLLGCSCTLSVPCWTRCSPRPLPSSSRWWTGEGGCGGGAGLWEGTSRAGDAQE